LLRSSFIVQRLLNPSQQSRLPTPRSPRNQHHPPRLHRHAHTPLPQPAPPLPPNPKPHPHPSNPPPNPPKPPPNPTLPPNPNHSHLLKQLTTVVILRVSVPPWLILVSPFAF